MFHWIVRGRVMDLDEDKIDAAVFALLRLTLHDGQRAWGRLRESAKS
ncbi:hypothetical protein OCH239_04490 [Roseivivax halodurans JCM 10272]|uniref:Uncharacterized protein n=1 Tax=Roseivivax halodurans JCM 10272 TaxID=1449350 RepID=X7E061_9RHOB|nr:hypothetical protein OCH239_04490 [Roseivivax halodurans JCM 10272]